MRTRVSVLAAFLLVLAAAVAPGAAQADDVGAEVPWAGGLGKTNISKMSVAPTQQAAAAPGVSGMQLVGNSDKDGTTNSDLAFWGDLAYAGNYGGFRILDIKRDQPRVLVDFPCNGAQSDPTVWDTGKRRLLFQSVDSQQTTDDCSSRNTPLVSPGVREPGFEGIRIFDVTNPRSPRFIDGVQTDCGSHTNTLIPDAKNKRVAIYVSSYPLGSGIGPDCQPPHKKISILDVPYDVGSASDVEVKEQPLSTDTAPSPTGGFQGCHDITAILPTDSAVGACAGDGQVWDISDPFNPTTTDADEGEHTHIRPGGGDTFEFVHTSIVSPDLERFVLTDETGGGGAPTCNGAATTDGFYYYYDIVEPGEPAPALRSRYTIPRPQSPEICVSHNGNFIPVKGRNLMAAANYQGGTTVVDWDASGGPQEIAFADQEDQTGLEDAWSSYFYRDRIFVNGGLNRRGATGNRGLDVYRLTDRSLTKGAAKLRRLNPQTVERRVGRGGDDD